MNDQSAEPMREGLLLAVLTAVQFCHILDFVIIMPLGPQLMRSLNIGAHQFGQLVSAYTFSAAAAGLLGAAVLDRWDRKHALLWLLSAFGAGTLLCGLATTYPLLLAARVAAGASGGLLAAIVLAIVADQIPVARRGRAMGVVMGGFSAASVLGLPAGILLASHSGWQLPFLVLAVVTAGVVALGAWTLPAMRGHVVAAGDDGRQGAWRELWKVARHPVHLSAFAFTAVLMLANFSVITFMSPSLVQNVGLTEAQLGWVYLAGGIATAFSSPWFGRLADRHGAGRVFAVAAMASVIPMIAVTVLPRMSVPPVLVVTTVFMVLSGGRWVSALSLTTNAVEPRTRGAFMSLNSSVQQAASGVASLVAGYLVAVGPGGRLVGFPRVGVLSAASVLAAILLARRLGRAARRHSARLASPVVARA
ncbi:MAG: putative arabinose efflux permease, family [Gemmatimonadetes bacterium]|jgi:predicted MFS family arabinose efflux permease|nr:putative arabinose efflux permease, family [Gemmatimonadota bacterium]